MQLFRGSISDREFLPFKVTLDAGLTDEMKQWLAKNYKIHSVNLKADVKHLLRPTKSSDCQLIFDADDYPMALRFYSEEDALGFIFEFK